MYDISYTAYPPSKKYTIFQLLSITIRMNNAGCVFEMLESRNHSRWLREGNKPYCCTVRGTGAGMKAAVWGSFARNDPWPSRKEIWAAGEVASHHVALYSIARIHRFLSFICWIVCLRSHSKQTASRDPPVFKRTGTHLFGLHQSENECQWKWKVFFYSWPNSASGTTVATTVNVIWSGWVQ